MKFSSGILEKVCQRFLYLCSSSGELKDIHHFHKAYIPLHIVLLIYWSKLVAFFGGAGDVRKRLGNRGARVNSLHFTEGSTFLYSCSSNWIYKWNVEDGQIIQLSSPPCSCCNCFSVWNAFNNELIMCVTFFNKTGKLKQTTKLPQLWLWLWTILFLPAQPRRSSCGTCPRLRPRESLLAMPHRPRLLISRRTANIFSLHPATVSSACGKL